MVQPASTAVSRQSSVAFGLPTEDDERDQPEAGGDAGDVDGGDGTGQRHQMAEAGQQPEAAAVIDAFLPVVARHEAQHMRPHRDIETVEQEDDGEPRECRAPEGAAAQKGGGDHDGQELGQNRAGQKGTGGAEPPLRPAQQRHRQQADGDGVDMAIAGERPQHERIPGVDEHALGGQTNERQQPQQADDRHHLEGEHRELHGDDALADAADDREHHLRRGRIDRARIAAAVDVGIDRAVPQRRQRRIGGNVAVGVDAGGLDAAIPDIAVYIARQQQRVGDQDHPHDHGDTEDEPDGAAALRPAQHEPHGAEIDENREAEEAHEEVDMERRTDRARARLMQQQAAGHQRAQSRRRAQQVPQSQTVDHRAGRGRGIAFALPQQHAERRRIVDIIPGWKLDQVEPDLPRPHPRRLGDTVGAPGNVAE
jgi:hypothetical protein